MSRTNTSKDCMGGRIGNKSMLRRGRNQIGKRE